jgi:hypothetical protein
LPRDTYALKYFNEKSVLKVHIYASCCVVKSQCLGYIQPSTQRNSEHKYKNIKIIKW